MAAHPPRVTAWVPGGGSAAQRLSKLRDGRDVCLRRPTAPAKASNGSRRDIKAHFFIYLLTSARGALFSPLFLYGGEERTKAKLKNKEKVERSARDAIPHKRKRGKKAKRQ